MNLALTPGLDTCASSHSKASARGKLTLVFSLLDYKAFVLSVRAVENALGIICDVRTLVEPLFDPIAREAIIAAVPIIVDLAKKYAIPITFGVNDNPFSGREFTSFYDMSFWSEPFFCCRSPWFP